MMRGPDMLFFWIALWCYVGGTVAASVYFGTRRELARGVTYWVTVAGLAANTVAIAVRWTLGGHPPLVNLFEYLTLFAWTVVVAFVVLWRRRGLELLTVFAAPLALALMVVASLFPARVEQQLIPALQSYWLWIHVSLAVLAEAAFTVAFVASVLYLVGESRGWERLPDRDLLDAVTYRWVGIGFPLFTIGALFAGAVWAHRAWGSAWSWDPKETSSLIVWLIYAIYLHVRLVRGLKGSTTAWISIAGFAMTIFTILGSKILGGLHSYG